MQELRDNFLRIGLTSCLLNRTHILKSVATLTEGAALLKPKKRIGLMRRKRVLGYYVRVDEHGREGKGET